MLEMMLSLKPKTMLLYPDSGPGPQVLKNGTEELGLFGTLSLGELILEPALRLQLDLWGGTSTGIPQTWVKMFVDGKIIFFTSAVLATGLDFPTMYNAGLTTGDGDTPSIGYPLVTQRKYVFVNDRVYKARLFRRTVIDPEQVTTTPVNTGQALVSEVGRVMNSAVLWKAITASSYNVASWCGTTNSISQNTAHTFTAATLSQATRTLTMGWVPVLELIPRDQVPLLAVNAFEHMAETKVNPLVPVIGEYTPAVIPIIRQSSGGITAAPVLPTAPEYSDYIKVIPNTSKTYLTTLPRGVIPSITYE